MGRAISNKNVLTAKFEVADFDGAFLASFGRPELRGGVDNLRRQRLR